MNKQRYAYNGGVASFGKVVDPKFATVTYATSPKQAANNVLWQYRQKTGLAPNSRLALTDKVFPA